MPDKSYSIRTILVIIVVLTAVLAVTSSVISTVIHQDLIFESHRSVLSKMIEIETGGLLDDLKSTSADLGLSFQKSKTFKLAIQKNDSKKITELLDNQFHQFFVTAGIIKLEQIAFLNKNFQATHESKDGSIPVVKDGISICRDLFVNGASRKGAERFRIIAGMCHHNDKPLYAVILPVGGLQLKGYLLVMTNPVYSLHAVETSLGIPVVIKTARNNIVYKSEHWPKITEDVFLSDYVLRTDDGDDVLTIVIAQNTTELNRLVSRAMLIVLIVSLIGVILIVGFGTWLLKRTTLIPLRELTSKIDLFQTDRTSMGSQTRVHGVSEVSTLISGFNKMSKDMLELYNSLEHMAYTDALTNLPNRNQFQDELIKYIQLYKSTRKKFTIFLMDLDRFKAVNDALGHNIGDQLLKKVGEKIQEILRDDDIVSRLDETVLRDSGIVARLGGDEFATLFPSVSNAENAVIISRKLIRAFEEPILLGEHHLTVGMSIGIAIYPDHGENIHTLISNADVAMYYAKRKKCGFAIYESRQNMNSMINLRLEQDLFAAIKKDELELHYQPKMDVNTRKVVGVEALVRWRHPKHGMIFPDDFIPLAEQTGLIQPLTEWVLNRALEDHGALRISNKHITVSVNLSAQNLRDDRMTKFVSAALKKWSVAPEYLVLELTESTIMTDPELAIRVLEELDAMHVKLSIDDFGTGHSSLSYVKNLPVDELKIDKSFVLELAQSSNDKAIVHSVLVLAHHMNMTVTAEGVEDNESLKILHDLGCDTAQGYYFARPMPLDDYLKWDNDYTVIHAASSKTSLFQNKKT